MPIEVQQVVIGEDPPTIQFQVTLHLRVLTPPSDADGELFNQRVGKEILRQVIQHLREDDHA